MAQTVEDEGYRDIRPDLAYACEAHGGDYQEWEYEAACKLPSGARVYVNNRFQLGPRVEITDANGQMAVVEGARHIRMHPIGASTQIGDEEVKLDSNDVIDRIKVVGGRYFS